ncbi:MAG: M23 family metallopeptidase [Rhodobacterales bacterium]
MILTSALPASAEVFRLIQPIDCTLGQDCFIQQFVDHDPGPDAMDFTCNALTYDTHTGTDFALPSLAAMEAGVAVIATASGQVTAIRDGMPDSGLTLRTANDIEGRDCGNGVVIRHADDWETQYCHLMQGSVVVTRGQTVATGDHLGLVGLSGNTEFPHLHLTVRHKGEVVDPFTPEGLITCNEAQPLTLWADPIVYVPGAILNAGFSTAVPDYPSVKAGTADQQNIPRDAPALVIWGYAFGGRAGDVMRITIIGPDGQSVTDHSDTLEKDQAQFFRAAGRRTPAAGWPSGSYAGQVLLLRGEALISSHDISLNIE